MNTRLSERLEIIRVAKLSCSNKNASFHDDSGRASFFTVKMHVVTVPSRHYYTEQVSNIVCRIHRLLMTSQHVLLTFEGRAHITSVCICVCLLSMASSPFPLCQTGQYSCDPCIKTGQLRNVTFRFIALIASRIVALERLISMQSNAVSKQPQVSFQKLF